MEFKVRKESQTLMEKTFNKYARKGSVSTDMIPSMMKQMQPDWNIEQSDLSMMIGLADRNGTGNVDLEGFNKIALHFLLKQAKKDHDQFIHKHEIGVQDFGDA